MLRPRIIPCLLIHDRGLSDEEIEELQETLNKLKGKKK